MQPLRFLSRKLDEARHHLAHAAFAVMHPGGARRLKAELPPIVGDLPSADAPVVIFCGADKTYMLRFAEPLATSLAAASETAHLHFHLFGTPDGATTQAYGALADRLGQGRVSLTWEDCDLSGMSPRRRIMYFQAVRFVRLADIAAAVNAPFLSMDVDAIFLQTLGRLLALCSGSDVAMVMRPREHNPAKKVRGALLYLAPTSAARTFLERAAERMLVGLFHGPEDMYPDQRAIAEALSRSPGLRLKPLPPEALSSEAEDAIVFSGRGTVKDAQLPEVFARRFGAPP
jgi:hypothetical protein